MIPELHIDIETRCELDVTDVGVHRYAEHPSLRVIVFAYAWNDDPVTVLDLSKDEHPGDSIPDDVWYALEDPGVLKVAHNAPFEITCLRRFFGLSGITAEQWFCTLVGSAYLGLPLSLEKVAEVLHLTEQKDTRGKALIRYFCKPPRETKKNGGRPWNEPEHDPQAWSEFMDYCAQDVRTEREIHRFLKKFPSLTETERRLFVLDQQINDRGIAVDRSFCEAAIEADERFVAEAKREIIAITGVDNPGSPVQLKRWICEQCGTEDATFSLAAEKAEEMIEDEELPKIVRKVLRLRLLSSRTSTKKYLAILVSVCDDDRIRGLLQYYGANRTGRWAGRRLQPQNLKRMKLHGLDVARVAVKNRIAELLYEDISEIVSQLVRTALVAKEGHRLNVADFSAIEARVIAWLAGEEWVLDIFRTTGKIYEATAARMMKKPIDAITKEDRTIGKVTTLALGYQGGAGALLRMAEVYRVDIPVRERWPIVYQWRDANPMIVKLWRKVEKCAYHVVQNRTSYTLKLPYTSIGFRFNRGYLFIDLPSGRSLAYYGAAVKDGKLTYYGMNQETKQWERNETYGGKLVENITQAIARDCLADVMLRVDTRGLQIVFHVHDELIDESRTDQSEERLNILYEEMAIPPEWAQGLPLKGEGYSAQYYKKE